MRTVTWVVFAALAGCGSYGWDPGVRPVPAEGSSPEFAAKVDAAVQLWQSALGCSDVFSGATGTGFIYERSPSEFAAEGFGPTVSGNTWSDKVWINGLRPDMEEEILVHELGHVLGLEHVAPVEDPSSVMHPIDDGIVIPDLADVERVGCR